MYCTSAALALAGHMAEDLCDAYDRAAAAGAAVEGAALFSDSTENGCSEATLGERVDVVVLRQLSVRRWMWSF